MRIVISEIKKGRSINWIDIYAFIPQLDVNRKFLFNFCGTELSTNASIMDEDVEKFRLALLEKVGYAPYDEEGVREVLAKSRFDTIDNKWY